MQRARLWVGLLAVLPLSFAAAQQAPAPTEPVTPAPPPPPGLIDRPQVIPVEKPEKKNQPEQPARPASEHRPATPATVKDLVKDFQAARAAFLAEQKELRRQLGEASAEQREAIREKLKENLAVWLEIQRTRVQELREQIRETKQAVQGYDKVIDAAQEKGRRP